MPERAFRGFQACADASQQSGEEPRRALELPSPQKLQALDERSSHVRLLLHGQLLDALL